MDPIFADFSPAALAAINEQNYFAWLPIFGKLGQYIDDTPPGVRRAACEIDDPIFNSIMDARLAPESADAAIAAVIADLRARGVPGMWWVGPSSQPDDLEARLLRHGFTLAEEIPGMALDLEKLNEDIPCPEGLTVERGPEDLTADPNPSELAWHQVYRNERETMLLYRGLMDGKQVAGCMLLPWAGVAGVYAVWVNKEYRRHGIGAWMTLHALREARRLGYRVAVLQSSQMGQGVYKSLGFEETFKLRVYLWQPPTPGSQPV